MEIFILAELKLANFHCRQRKKCKQKITLYRRHTLVRATIRELRNDKNATPSILRCGVVYENSDIFNIIHRQLNYSSSDFYAFSGLPTNEAKSILKLTF